MESKYTYSRRIGESLCWVTPKCAVYVDTDAILNQLAGWSCPWASHGRWLLDHKGGWPPAIEPFDECEVDMLDKGWNPDAKRSHIKTTKRWWSFAKP